MEPQLCWPDLPLCYSLPQPLQDLVLISLLLSSAVAAGLFIYKRVSPAYFTLGLATILKILFYLQDYRYMGNYHYMQFWMLAGFFFIPQKRQTLPVLLVSFYLGASLLKFNREWLSGASLFRRTFLSGVGLELACLYVVVLESFLVWGLLIRRPAIFWSTLAQLILFHSFSYLIVGFFYPVVMFCLLSLPVFLHLLNENSRSPWPSNKLALFFLALFVAAQVPALLSERSDLTGEGRLLALNMLDSNPVCQPFYTARFQNEVRELPPVYTYLGVRLACDKGVVLAGAEHYCRKFAGDSRFEGLDVALLARRRTDSGFRKVIEEFDFCRGRP